MNAINAYCYVWYTTNIILIFSIIFYALNDHFNVYKNMNIMPGSFLHPKLFRSNQLNSETIMINNNNYY